MSRAEVTRNNGDQKRDEERYGKDGVARKDKRDKNKTRSVDKII